jgi:hypothetical protein
MNWSQTFTAGTAATFRLSSFKGKVAYLNFCLRAAVGNASAANRTYTALSSTTNAEALYEELDAKGQNVQGGSALPSTFLRYIESAQHWVGAMRNSIPIYSIVYCDPVQALQGRVIGYRYHDTYQQLKLTPGASFSTGSYQLDVHAAIFRHTHIQNNRIKVMDDQSD